ncbi:MAG TPA: hypothetical protein VI756_00295, partial [Blastocatellia bacterium]
MFDGVLMIGLWIVVGIAILFTVIPIGNERSTVRRLPWVTFSIMAINTAVFFLTLPLVTRQNADVAHARRRLEVFNLDHHELLADKTIRDQLLGEGLITLDLAHETEQFIELDPKARRDYQLFLNSPAAATAKTEFDTLMSDYKVATSADLVYQLGLAPNGQWKFYQLVTNA